MLPNGLGAIVVNRGSGTLTILAAVPTTAVAPEPPKPITEVELAIYPTPSNGAATLAYALPTRGTVTLEIYDVQGRLVRQLVNEMVPAGRHTVTWTGEDRAGGRAATGVYLARLRAGGRELHKRIVWLR